MSLDAQDRGINAEFRTGTEWFSLYRDDRKIGLIKSRRSREGETLILENDTRIESALGHPGRVELQLRTELDPGFELLRFSARVSSPWLSLRAHGARVGEELHVEIAGLPGGSQKLVFPLRDAPRFEQALRPSLLRRGLEPGTRLEFEIFNPLTMGPEHSYIHYRGVETLEIMGATRRAHRFEQKLAGQSVRFWLNDAGELLREELGSGVFAQRESEAEALFFAPEVDASARAREEDP